MLETYCEKQGWEVVAVYQDDGYTGLNMERPDLKRMLKAIERRQINLVITKDLSRLGRNYLQTGTLIEDFFPRHGVRYIAMNDGIDTMRENNDIAPFKNILNEMYSKDISKKVHSSYLLKAQQGQFTGCVAPFGYRKDPEDKNHLLIDEEAAKVVRRIYQMVIDGMGSQAIANQLTADNVLIPSAYLEQSEHGESRNHSYHDPCRWNCTAVSYILDKQEYMGHTVLGKTICENFKTKKRRKARPDELIIFENTHEPIIDAETWHLVQKLRRRTRRKLANGSYSHRLSGLVYCADCGKRLSYSSPQSQHRPDGKTYDADSSFRCPTYKSMYGECTMHYIKSSTLDKLVDEAVRKIARYVLRNEQAFLEQVRVLTSADQKHTQSEDKKELVNIKKRIAELDNYIKRLYEGNASGKIPDRQFEKLMAQYDSEQQELEERVKEIEVSIHEIQQESENGQQFVRLVQKYRDLTEIDQTALNEFIDKVVVHEATGGRTADRSQQIDIYFNFIGQFMVEDTEEELLMQEQEAQRLADLKERERKDRRNETVRRYRQRKKEREVKQAESVSG